MKRITISQLILLYIVKNEHQNQPSTRNQTHHQNHHSSNNHTHNHNPHSDSNHTHHNQHPVIKSSPHKNKHKENKIKKTEEKEFVIEEEHGERTHHRHHHEEEVVDNHDDEIEVSVEEENNDDKRIKIKDYFFDYLKESLSNHNFNKRQVYHTYLKFTSERNLSKMLKMSENKWKDYIKKFIDKHVRKNFLNKYKK